MGEFSRNREFSHFCFGLLLKIIIYYTKLNFNTMKHFTIRELIKSDTATRKGIKNIPNR
jgi:hypothetical protein